MTRALNHLSQQPASPGSVLSRANRWYRTVPGYILRENRRFYTALNIAMPCGMAIYLLMAILFALLGVYKPALFNLVGMLTYAVMFALNRMGLHKHVLVIGTLDLIGHSWINVMFLGVDSAFHIYLLMAGAAIFLLESCSILFKCLVIVATAIAYAFIDLYFRNAVPLHPIAPAMLDSLFITNILFTVTLITILTYSHANAAEVAEEKLFFEYSRAEDLLHNILPAKIAKQLKDYDERIVERFESASILFADIVGFTRLSEKLSPDELIEMLNGLFSQFDDAAIHDSVEKIKTIGDAYMLAAGIPEPGEDHAANLTAFARKMMAITTSYNRAKGYDLHLRIGIHSGPVIAGVIGKSKFIYDIWGDTVNTASRLETYGNTDEIHLSSHTRDLLPSSFKVQAMEPKFIKDKGNMLVYKLVE